MLELASAGSMRVSLDAIRRGVAGLDEHRAALLERVPAPGNYANFPYEHLTMKDLAYLTAHTGDEFAILRGKKQDILFHGTPTRCTFDELLSEMLTTHRLTIYGHSHPGEEVPVPSGPDIETLKNIGQKKSRLISGMTGIEIEFTDNPFDVE